MKKFSYIPFYNVFPIYSSEKIKVGLKFLGWAGDWQRFKKLRTFPN
ncbi:hypothetical protein LEP1GSC151_0265 [Leptospira interrogans serovar Grippotyphosa str. LT2186]|uniref:Uncharacterized protein n=1 Tax=Leptospira interrogans serovar Grippotyphosa str. LT2186 TaxID=1001599 RepID=M3FZ84_LEPIR|nr:hypothetical protein LEP1GSC151_0265 [Leptospira interrogans serovar Grippotyphosa str. LT2186]